VKKLLIAVSFLLAVPLFGAYQSYLKIQGVKGGSKDPNHKDWIELSSFSRGAGRANAAVEQATFTITDAALQPQFTALVSRGTPLLTVIADIGPVRYTMSHVVVSSVTPPGSARGGAPMGFGVTLNFSNIEMTATSPQEPRQPGREAVTASIVKAPVAPPPNAEFLIDNRIADRFRLLGLQRQGNSAVLQLRDSSGFFRQAAGKTRNPKVTVQTPYYRVTMNDCLISSYAPNPDGTATVTLNFAQYSGPVSFRQ
jgi:type VI protein secretion system component Hcp